MSIVAYTQRVIDRSFYFCSHINCKDILLQALTRVLLLFVLLSHF